MRARPPPKCSRAAARTPACRGRIRRPARAAPSRRSPRPIPQDGFTCRDFLASYVRGRREAWLQGEACRTQQGGWEVKSLQALQAAADRLHGPAAADRNCDCRAVAQRPTLERIRVARRRAGWPEGPITEFMGDARPLRGAGGDRKSASAGDIKSAFRQLAKKLHPDANKNDRRRRRRFAELNAAYEILGDEDKRKAFDRGEIDAEGKPRFQGFEGARARGGGPARGFGHEGEFETFTLGPEGFTRGGGARRRRPSAAASTTF